MKESSGMEWDVIDEARKHWAGARDEARRWERGRKALYELCASANHEDVDATISKLWLIGRSHAAALERTHVGHRGDVYFDAATRLRTAKVDEALRALAAIPATYDEKHRNVIATCVARVTHILLQVTEQEKVSLASKYLHYHVAAIPIFDSISDAAFRALAPAVTRGTDVYAGHLIRFEYLFNRLRLSDDLHPIDARTIDDFALWWWRE